jgi:hypothetical protein
VLPYRLSNTARLYRTALDEYGTDRFDLAGTRALVDRVERRQAAIESRGSALSPRTAPRVNRALLKASHLLNATLYSGAGRFHQDPAFPQPLLPSLAGLRELKTMTRRVTVMALCWRHWCVAGTRWTRRFATLRRAWKPFQP